MTNDGCAADPAPRVELAFMCAFGLGWLVALLSIPAMVWLRLLRLEPSWMSGVVISSSILPISAALLYALVDGFRRLRR